MEENVSRAPRGSGGQHEVRTGVMIINLGTPEAPTPKHLRRYLREFLGDPFVDLGPPRPIWWFILNFIVLPFRPRKSAEMYKRVWTAEGPPLTVFSRRQQHALQRELGNRFHVELGYRYGEPSILNALKRLVERGCNRVVAIPLYPQDSSASYGTSVRQLERVLANWKGQAPLVEVIPPFFDHDGYVRAVATQIREAAKGRYIEHYVFSYHGVPRSFIEKGEPYDDHCRATSRALATELGLSPDQWTHAYQSKFGRAEWIQPPTDKVIAGLGSKYRRILVACPGFPADCLETIDEIGSEAAHLFRNHGGEELVLAPGLNDSPGWVKAMAEMVRAERVPAG